MGNTFMVPAKIISGTNVIDELGEHIKGKGTKALIVTDQFMVKFGNAAKVENALKKVNVPYVIFDGANTEPTDKIVEAGLKVYKETACDFLIALGGGSPMDTAKAIAFMSVCKGKISDYMHTVIDMEVPYLVAIPTTAGTGSEVTPFAVITDEKTGVKYPLADYQLLPNMAIIDADFHMSAPKGLTSASGIDAVTHALEAYASIMATDYTDGLALKALKTIFEYLPRAYDNGPNDPEAREKMANAATMAGMAFANAFLGVCHSMAHKLGAFHHIPHGIANALMIDEVLRFNSSEAPTKMGTFSQYDHPHTLRRYAEVAEYLGIKGKNDQEKVDNLIKAIDELKARVGIKPTIKDYVPDEKDFLDRLDAMCEQAFDDQCTGANPRYPLISEIKQMYLDAYYGKTFVETEKPDAKQLKGKK